MVLASWRYPVGILVLVSTLALFAALHVVLPVGQAMSTKLDHGAMELVIGGEASTTTKVLTGVMIATVAVFVVAAVVCPFFAPAVGAAALSALGGWGGAAGYVAASAGAACAAWGPCQPD